MSLPAGWQMGGNVGPAGAWTGTPAPGGYVVGGDGYIYTASGGNTGVLAPIGLPAGSSASTIGQLANAAAPGPQAAPLSASPSAAPSAPAGTGGPAQDPYGGAYKTASDPFVAADGVALGSVDPSVSGPYWSTYGNDAPIIFAEARNRDLLSQGKAVQTPHGIVSVENAMFAINKAGYNGPSDVPSIAGAYQMLATPAPTSAPSPANHSVAAATLQAAGINISSSFTKPILYAGLAFVAYEMFFKRGHR